MTIPAAARDNPRPESARRATARRLGEHGLRPNQELGQNFLVDDNLLGVIERAAELQPAGDVVLEVGGGLGTLSQHLAPRVRHLHVVEVDRSLRAPLEEALAPHRNTTLHIGDATRMELTELDPPPSKVVANLPYGVAATVLVKTVLELPLVGLWVAMVQREVGERLAAAPGSRSYGVTSAIAQSSCAIELLRRVGHGAFFPPPHVESALVRLRRLAPPASPATVALIHAAFAHRRKALSGSLALAAGARPGLRERAREALPRLGHSPDARAERLSPRDFEALAAALGDDALPSAGGR